MHFNYSLSRIDCLLVIKRLIYFVGHFLFLVIFFWILRLIFLIYNYELSLSLTIKEWFSVFLYGSRMDASISGYIGLLAAVILVVTTFFSGKIIAKVMLIYTMIMLTVSSLLAVADMELYRHWGFRLDSTPLSYLKTPKEALGSASLLALLIQICVFVMLMWVVWRTYKKFLHPILLNLNSKHLIQNLLSIPIFLFAGALMILPIRGSLGVAPMNIGFVYFHPNKIFANHAAINVVWNAGKSLLNSNKINEYRFMEEQVAEELFATCYPPIKKTEIVLNQKRPNIVILILESFSNRLIEPLGGLPDVTPNFNRLCTEGIVFSNLYSNSDRTDKGILGILNGYPVHPVAKVINFPEKTRRLPYINKDLKQVGYNTGFVYGYDILYSNFASYFGNAEYDKLITRADFSPETYKNSKWGVHDHLVLEKLLDECNNTKQPFFQVFVGLSSHEPFDVPMPTVIEGYEAERRFLNSVYYSDKALGDFIEAARQTDWWENTLFIITSDHGSRHPGNLPNYVPEKFHIPMLWIGGAVAKTNKVVPTIASQTDIPLTILHQLGLKNDTYSFSKDIFGTPVYPFAFYNFNNGFGFVADDTRIAFDNVNQAVIFQEGTNVEEKTEKGKAYLQIFSKDFIKRDSRDFTRYVSTFYQNNELLYEVEPEIRKVIIENLVNIKEIDNTFFVDLKYATTDNFTGVVLYEGLEDAFLQPDVAQMLVEAHRYLKSLHPELRLLVYDAARPLSVQRAMWERVKDTPFHRYVANPDRLSLHNFGAAVDLTIVDSFGNPLDMGTPFDFFGRAAGINDEEGLVKQGLITQQHVQNRQLLRQVMRHVGFRTIHGEWWHFNACSLTEAKQRYTLIEDF